MLILTRAHSAYVYELRQSIPFGSSRLYPFPLTFTVNSTDGVRSESGFYTEVEYTPPGLVPAVRKILLRKPAVHGQTSLPSSRAVLAAGPHDPGYKRTRKDIFGVSRYSPGSSVYDGIGSNPVSTGFGSVFSELYRRGLRYMGDRIGYHRNRPVGYLSLRPPCPTNRYIKVTLST